MFCIKQSFQVNTFTVCFLISFPSTSFHRFLQLRAQKLFSSQVLLEVCSAGFRCCWNHTGPLGVFFSEVGCLSKLPRALSLVVHSSAHTRNLAESGDKEHFWKPQGRFGVSLSERFVILISWILATNDYCPRAIISVALHHLHLSATVTSCVTIINPFWHVKKYSHQHQVVIAVHWDSKSSNMSNVVLNECLKANKQFPWEPRSAIQGK